jgi:hypothetical protein
MSDKFNFKRTKERSFQIEIDNISKRHLMFFMQNELSYYNNVINNGTMRLRAFPEEIVAMREGFGRLWAAIAFTGKNIREFLKEDIKKWPQVLKDAVPQIAIQNGRVSIDEKKLMLFDAISVTGNIHPAMRQHIASELLSTMLPQADQLVQCHKSTTGQMKDPVHMLVPREYPERRHIQLTRDLIKMSYNKEKEQTEITVPYTDKPLIIKDHDLTAEKFNVMLIRQQPNVSVNANTPWQIDLMITSHKYLMDIVDQNLYTKKKRVA